MTEMKFCPHCGKPVDPGGEDSVNGSHEPHGKNGVYHGPCWNAVLRKQHGGLER